MTEVGSRRCLDLDLHRVERSRFDSGALALLSGAIPDVLDLPHLRLYRNGRTGGPFVGGPPLTDLGRGPRRFPLTLHGGIQEICTALARAALKDAIRDEYGDVAEAPAEYAWLDDPDHEARFGAIPRNDRVEFDAIERIDRLRPHPQKRGVFRFRLTVAGQSVGDGVTIDDCEIADIKAEWPTALAPKMPRPHSDDDRYARISPESARRIAAIINGILEQPEAAR
jgi:hypothetical protein